MLTSLYSVCCVANFCYVDCVLHLCIFIYHIYAAIKGSGLSGKEDGSREVGKRIGEWGGRGWEWGRRGWEWGRG